MALNTRMPEKLAGDMRAQVAACHTAEKSFRQLVERHGSIDFRRILDGMHDYAERMMRAEIAALPDGTWSFTDYLDGLGEHPEPLALRAAVTVAGEELTVDWTGSALQVPGAINCPSPFVKSAVHLVLKCIAREDIPNFEGIYKTAAGRPAARDYRQSPIAGRLCRARHHRVARDRRSPRRLRPDRTRPRADRRRRGRCVSCDQRLPPRTTLRLLGDSGGVMGRHA